MLSVLQIHLSNWKKNNGKWRPSFIGRGIVTLARHAYRDYVDRRNARVPREVTKRRQKLLTPGIEAEYVEILLDPEFASSVAQIKGFTCQDFARLANLWNLARAAGPGTFLEVGSFLGGTALHICNAIAHRDAAFYCFDPFERAGFENMTELDQCFKPDDFTSTQYEVVAELLSSKPNAKVIQGFFPAAAANLDLQNIAFCHLDVDMYNATKESLQFLAPRLAPRAIIVIDDYHHIETPGVAKAVEEFLAENPSFLLVPMFPVQAVLVPKGLW